MGALEGIYSNYLYIYIYIYNILISSYPILSYLILSHLILSYHIFKILCMYCTILQQVCIISGVTLQDPIQEGSKRAPRRLQDSRTLPRQPGTHSRRSKTLPKLECLRYRLNRQYIPCLIQTLHPSYGGGYQNFPKSQSACLLYTSPSPRDRG